MIESTYLTLVHHDKSHRQLFIDTDIIVDLSEDGQVLGIEQLGGIVDFDTLTEVIAHLRATPQ